jgi:hypothetical protein
LEALAHSNAEASVVREWSFVLAPIAVVSYFIVRPEQFGALVGLLGRYVH